MIFEERSRSAAMQTEYSRYRRFDCATLSERELLFPHLIPIDQASLPGIDCHLGAVGEM
jgi:hypothetical protein